MKKMTLSKMNAEINSSIQSLIETNELQSVLGCSNETYVVEESTAHQAAKQDSACYRAIIPLVKQRQAVYGTETKDTLSVPLNIKNVGPHAKILTMRRPVLTKLLHLIR